MGEGGGVVGARKLAPVEEQVVDRLSPAHPQAFPTLNLTHIHTHSHNHNQNHTRNHKPKPKPKPSPHSNSIRECRVGWAQASEPVSVLPSPATEEIAPRGKGGSGAEGSIISLFFRAQIKLRPRVMFDLTEVGVPEIAVCDCCARQLRASRRWVQTKIARLTNA